MPASLRTTFFGLIFCAQGCSAGHLQPASADASDQAPDSTLSATNANTASTSALPWPASQCPLGPYAATPWTGAAALETLSGALDGADWSEGPVWLAQSKRLVFGAASSTQDDTLSKKTTLHAYAPSTGTLSTLAAAGIVRSNGAAVDSQGRIVAACHQPQGIVSFAPDRPSEQSVLVASFENLSFDAPNDVVLHASGGLFFTDATYEQAGRAGQPNTCVYFVSAQGNVSVVDDTRNQPNGIALSLDHKFLLVGGLDKKIMRYSIDATGRAGPKSTWASFDSNIDGMTLDCAGNVYVSLNDTRRIAVLSPQGDLIATQTLPFAPSNLAFGDTDAKSLFITGEGGLYRIHTDIPGLPY